MLQAVSKDGAVVRALASHQCGFSSIRRHMWVEFVVGSRPRSDGFSSGTPVILSPKKPTLFKFKFDLKTVERGRATPWIPLKFPLLFLLKADVKLTYLRLTGKIKQSLVQSSAAIFRKVFPSIFPFRFSCFQKTTKFS